MLRSPGHGKRPQVGGLMAHLSSPPAANINGSQVSEPPQMSHPAYPSGDTRPGQQLIVPHVRPAARNTSTSPVHQRTKGDNMELLFQATVAGGLLHSNSYLQHLPCVIHFHCPSHHLTLYHELSVRCLFFSLGFVYCCTLTTESSTRHVVGSQLTFSE